jgi:hypothetical protein
MKKLSAFFFTSYYFWTDGRTDRCDEACRSILHLCIAGEQKFSCYIAGSILDEVIGFSNWRNPSSRTTARGSTQSLTEMSTRNLPKGKERPARKADNLIAIFEQIV